MDICCQFGDRRGNEKQLANNLSFKENHGSVR